MTIISSSFARIVDCRPFKSAFANKAKGMGYEDETRYNRTSITFQNIQNIHASRKSFDLLFALVCGSSNVGNNPQSSLPGQGWLGAVEGTGWLNHVRSILSASVNVARYVGLNGFPVLVHCSDGWDRTSQVCSLAEILLDPHFRTVKGLQVLIEKDWVSFGHKFMQRVGHGSDKDADERSPCFLLFLDCLWQLLHLFPKMFEYNDNLLICIADSLLCCKFGTFLCDCEADRKKMRLEKNSLSLWEYIDNEHECFVNDLYALCPIEERGKPILPHVSAVVRQVTLWDSYYLRYASSPSLNSQAFPYLKKQNLRLSLGNPDVFSIARDIKKQFTKAVGLGGG